MPSAVNGYSLNAVGEPADWSQREFNLLSAFAGLMPVSGSRVVSAGEHYHNELTDQYGVNRVYVTSAGKIGIGNGATSAVSFVHIKNGSTGLLPGGYPGYSYLTVEHNDNAAITILTPDNAIGILNFMDTFGTGSGGQIYYDHSTDTLGIDTHNNIQFMRSSNINVIITSADNVGIGTTNPSSKLDVSGTTKLGGTVSATSAVCLQSVYRAPDGGNAGNPTGIVATNYSIIIVSASTGNQYYNLSAGYSGQLLHIFNIGSENVYFNVPSMMVYKGAIVWWDNTNSTWLPFSES